jgi:hypothetical protein
MHHQEEHDKKAQEAHLKWASEKERARKEREAKAAEKNDNEDTTENFTRRLEIFESEQRKLIEKWSHRKQIQKEKEDLKREAMAKSYKIQAMRQTLDEEAMERVLLRREKTFDPSYSVSSDPISGPPSKQTLTSSKRGPGITLPPLS